MVTQTEDAEAIRRIFSASRIGINPSPEMYQAIAERPLIEIPDGKPVNWIVLGADAVRQILGDPKRFSNEPNVGGVVAGNLLQLDPPEHTRIRRLLAPEFAPRRIRNLQPMVEKVVLYCLDDLERSGSPGDLMRRFAYPITAFVSCELFGLPWDDAWEALRLDTIRSDGEGPTQRIAFAAYDTYGKKLVERARKNPGDDMMGRLFRKHGDELTDEDVHGMLDAVVFAQIEGTAQMLGLSVLALLEHPEELALLRAHPELMDPAAEELMRYLSIVATASPRVAMEDVEVAGRLIKKGQTVQCSLFAVNRSLPPEEDGLNIRREEISHVALGHGIHFCIGAGLARLELRVALTELFNRMPRLRLAVPADELSYRISSPQFGVNALPVTW